jgi:hypothetical protein
MAHLQHGLPKEDHLLARFFNDEVLDLEPFLALASPASGTEMNFPNRVFLVASSSGN